MAATAMAITAAMQLGSGYTKSVALGEQAKNEELAAQLDAEVAERNIKQKKKVAEENAQLVQKQGAKVKSAQRAGYAAGNVDVSSGSALAVQEETSLLAGLDAQKIRNNATLEAFGIKSAVQRNSLQAKYNAQVLRQQGQAELVSGIMQAGSTVGSYYANKPASKAEVGKPTGIFSGEPKSNKDTA